jgi:outer membrane protein TolC
VLNYTHPLLRGAGRAYNSSVVLLARIEADIARDEFVRQLQARLVEIARAYWDLHLERGSLLQRRRLYDAARAIQDALKGREQLDALRSQIVRADAAVARRLSDIDRAEAAVFNAESRIRALVNDPALGDSSDSELIPTESPSREFDPVDTRAGISVAMRTRPEVDQAMRHIKAAGVRCQMSKNELLPLLNVVLETYASGLRGNSDVGGAFVDQFQEGTPSYSVGLQYEVPIGNRAARARQQRRQLELRQLQSQFRATIEMLKLEVEVAGREVTTTYQEISSKFDAIRAAAAEVRYLQDRWELLPGDDRGASFLLEDLLEAQQRLAIAEFEYLDALRSYNVAQTVFRQATGVLLQSNDISFQQFCECHLPDIDIRSGRSDGPDSEPPLPIEPNSP